MGTKNKYSYRDQHGRVQGPWKGENYRPNAFRAFMTYDSGGGRPSANFEFAVDTVYEVHLFVQDAPIIAGITTTYTGVEQGSSSIVDIGTPLYVYHQGLNPSNMGTYTPSDADIYQSVGLVTATGGVTIAAGYRFRFTIPDGGIGGVGLASSSVLMFLGQGAGLHGPQQYGESESPSDPAGSVDQNVVILEADYTAAMQAAGDTFVNAGTTYHVLGIFCDGTL